MFHLPKANGKKEHHPKRKSRIRFITIVLILLFSLSQFFLFGKFYYATGEDESELNQGDNDFLSTQQVPTNFMPNKLDKNRVLAFQTMDLFSSHRMGIVSAVILAVIQQRILIIPKNMFCLAGIDCDKYYIYDQATFERALGKTGIQYQIIEDDLNLDLFEQFRCAQAYRPTCFEQIDSMYKTNRLFINHPEVIPFPKDDFSQYKELLKILLEGLVFSNKFQALKNKIVSRIQFICGSQSFSAISINKTMTDKQKISHMDVDEKVQIPYGTHASLQIQIKQFDSNTPLYVWGNDINTWYSESVTSLIKGIEDQQFNYVIENPVFSDIDLSQQYIFAINYFVSLEAERFLGDGALLVNQLVILERQLHGKWASYFNTEVLSLAYIYPVFDVPWIFTHSAWSPNIDYLVKVAVRSAVQVGKVTPYCLFSGERNSPIGRWLEAMGVTLIQHEPLWMSHLVMKNTKAKEYKDKHSHLYGTPEGIIGTFLRIDIPVLSELSQYPFVLYTDTDIYFRKRVDFTELPLPLPDTIGLGFELSNNFPYNAGVSLMNMFGLRMNYDKFLKFILSNEYALNFPGYGPGDQGALNQFYETTVKKWVLPMTFNGKPYFDFSEDTVIVHYHGPKPHDYYQYLTTDYCRPMFTVLCEWAVDRGMCEYSEEWAQFAAEDEIGQKLVQVCKTKKLEITFGRKEGLTK
eukprot:TRINITY_DN170_c1_g2_i1.p1 TRINITY_DN170_c1_g2~~TRINITY_DN170_c1_g2_i1.p1  ORF type:complete len:690 (-),score=36.56 TRINITY_DN170_c1_g2_i1:2016-4085(-)